MAGGRRSQDRAVAGVDDWGESQVIRQRRRLMGTEELGFCPPVPEFGTKPYADAVSRGGIPTSFGELSNLLRLELSHNMLFGEIPQQLTKLSFLSYFNVSYNQLAGPIPQGGQLSTFDNSSFIGNPGLCGSPLSNKCGNAEVETIPQHKPSSGNDEDSTDAIDWVIRSMGYLSGLVVGVILGWMITDKNHEWFVETFGRRKYMKKRRIG